MGLVLFLLFSQNAEKIMFIGFLKKPMHRRASFKIGKNS